MNEKLLNKAKLITAALGVHSRAHAMAKTEAVGYALAFEETLPSSEMRAHMTELQMVESKEVASYIGENTMLHAQDIFSHAHRFYEMRNAAAFNGLLYAAKLKRNSCAFECEETSSIVSTIVHRLTEGNTSSGDTIRA